jgi:putative ABC transport system permease protein
MYGTQTMVERLNQSLWVRRAYSLLFGAFALMATTLAALGVYGIISFTVSERKHEIGIRLALGAPPARVLRGTLMEGMSLVAIGVIAGLLGALWANNILRSLLYGVSSRDPVVYALAAAGVLAVGLLANLLPAWRAASTDPIGALRRA